jgi:hypothetical protein
LQGALGQAAVQLAVAQAATATALASASISQQIVHDGNATRALFQEITREELNRKLIERNAEAVECRAESRYYQNGMTNGQFSSVASQINALHSQFQSATQGTVNFGSMSGNAGRNTSTNNVV